MDLGHSPDTGASEGELRPPRILKTSLFLQKGGPRKEPSQRTATALFYLIPCGDFQLSPREFYFSLITPLQLQFGLALSANKRPTPPLRLEGCLGAARGPGGEEFLGARGLGGSLGRELGPDSWGQLLENWEMESYPLTLPLIFPASQFQNRPIFLKRNHLSGLIRLPI